MLTYARRAIVIAVTGVAVFGQIQPAVAADNQAPVIDANDVAAFVVGDVISPSADGSDPDTSTEVYTQAPVQFRVRWTAHDNSGELCAYRVYFHTWNHDSNVPIPEEGIPWTLEVDQRTPSPTTVQDIWEQTSWPDYDNCCGGGRTMGSWLIEVEDCAGNTSQFRMYGAYIHVNQEDGNAANGSTGTFNYQGNWSQVNCLCASGAHMRKTSQDGASVTFTRTYARDDHVALVMAAGPGRGKAAIFYDGKRFATMDTFAPSNENRVVVFDKWMPAGTHKIRVVNLATPRHPRIDLDAVLTNHAAEG